MYMREGFLIFIRYVIPFILKTCPAYNGVIGILQKKPAVKHFMDEKELIVSGN